MTGLLLRAASWIVPGDGRRGWLDEWRAELWHVRQVDPAQAMGFCLGAFRDAVWLRRHHRAPRPHLLASPVRCLGLLAAVAGLGFALRPAERRSVELVEMHPHTGRQMLTFDQYLGILEHFPKDFEAIAFYQPRKHGPAVATASIREVLRGSLLPGGNRYVIMKGPGEGSGYVIARMSVRPPDRPWHIRIPSPDGGFLLLDCGPAVPRVPFIPFLVMLFAVLTLLAGTSTFSVGPMPARGWIFLAVKLTLALAAVWFAAWLLPPPAMPQVLIVGWVFATRWAFADQRRRCPVCLRRVTNPVSFGCLSHTLLDWHGAEYICPEGHGLMQISATVASPYAATQWVRL